MRVSLVVLGSGQDGGSPQVGRGVGTGPDRTASCVAIAVDGGPLVLFDATPDLRVQDARLRAMGHRAQGGNPYDAVFITHAHMGHYAGLVHFGKEAAATERMPLVAPASVVGFLSENQPWRALLDAGRLAPISAEDGPVRFGPLLVEGIPVPHRSEFGSTVGYSVSVDSEPWILYVPDIDSWKAWSAAEGVLGSHRICLLDAAFGSPDELPGRDISKIPHPFVSDTITRFADLANGRRMILTHMNHSNTLAEPASDLSIAAARAGFEVARDGLTIEWSP